MKETTVYQGPIFNVIQKKMTINGVDCLRDIVVHPGGAAICAVMDEKILLVEQTRAGVQEKTLEIPAGMVDPGEQPHTAVLRELNEETGYQAEKASLITPFWPTPGYDSEVIWLYEAVHVTPAPKRLAMDATEDISCFWIDLDTAWKMVKEQKIRDGKTILAILYSLLQRQNG